MFVRNVSGPKAPGSDIDLEAWIPGFAYKFLEKVFTRVIKPVFTGSKIRVEISKDLEIFIINEDNPDPITLAVEENRKIFLSWPPEVFRSYEAAKLEKVATFSGKERKKAKAGLALEFGLNPAPWNFGFV